MNYRVVLTENAKANLGSYFERAAANAPATAIHWLERFQQSLQSLSHAPQRCPLAPENEFVTEEIRQLVVGRKSGAFRALFLVDQDEVRILHIRRAAMDLATPADLLP